MATDHSQQNVKSTEYSLEAGTKAALQSLLHRANRQIPAEIKSHADDVIFSSLAENKIFIPCPLKETEAASALKAVEAGAVAAIADIRYGKRKKKIEVDLERAPCFLFAAYLTTIDGMDKRHPKVMSKLKDRPNQSSINACPPTCTKPATWASSSISTDLLEATTALNMIGLEGRRPDMTDYHECIKLIEDHVKQFSAAELKEMNAQKRQAGVRCLKFEDFKKTEYGQGALDQPP